MGELVVLVLGIAAWIAWTKAFENNPPWGTAAKYWTGFIVIIVLTSIGMGVTGDY